jgi:hypothetical protein
VLFSDLMGSTEISARLDPEEFKELVADYHHAAAERSPASTDYVREIPWRWRDGNRARTMLAHAKSTKHSNPTTAIADLAHAPLIFVSLPLAHARLLTPRWLDDIYVTRLHGLTKKGLNPREKVLRWRHK